VKGESVGQAIKSVVVISFLFSGLLVSTICFADLVIEQECRLVSRSESMISSPTETATDYQRRIFIKGDLLVIQLVVNNIPTREYGLDFGNNIYYESDLINNDYRKYLFSKINEEFAKEKTKNLIPAHGTGFARAIFQNANFVNYKISSAKSIFRKKQIGDFNCVLYGYKIGPGFSRFQPLSWGKDIKAWVTKDIPVYGEYEKVSNRLKEEIGFYRNKLNEISDFIIVLMESDGFPVEIHGSSARDFGMGRLYGKDDAVSVKFETRSISDTEISYFNNDFTLNPVGKRDISPAEQMPFPNITPRNNVKNIYFRPVTEKGPLGIFYSFLVPVVFYLGLVFYSYKSVTKKTSEPTTSRLVFNFYLLFVFMYFLELLHIFVPYLKSIDLEFSIILIIGSAIIVGSHYSAIARNRNAAIDSTHAKICPYCKAVIDRTFAVCPKCNKRIAQ
jgi:hypothetical protein